MRPRCDLRALAFLLISLLLVLINGAVAQDRVVNSPEVWPSGVYHFTNLTVNSGGGISVDGEGYAGAPDCGANLSGGGPGGGPFNCDNAGNGGSYGGKGSGPNTASMTTYGSSLAPVDLGSGGSAGWNASWQGIASGGNGGGAIGLIVSGTLTNNGVISANGFSGGGSNGSAGGAGSGGSVYVTTSTLAGSGVFQANGGQTWISGSPSVPVLGGGGGRVAVYYSDGSNYTGFTTSTATGGVNTGGASAGDGTVGFFDTSQANKGLYVYKLFSIDPRTTATYDSINVANAGTITIGGGSAIAVTNTVAATGNSTILLQGMNGSAQVNGQWQGQGVSLTVGNVQVDAGSSISADAQGYAGNNCSGPGSGPGGGPHNCNNAGNGGSYGGQGGGPNPAPIYGSDFAPFDLGSGGSGGFMAPPGGSGGGAIRLVVLNTLTNNGTITANGGGASSGSGGGSGGSVYVTAGTLAGNGTFNANGGASQYGGGGGRVAVYYAINNSFG